MRNSQQSFQQSQTDQKDENFKCMQLLQKIDLSRQPNRQWLSKCYRKLTQFINSSANMKFNLIQKSLEVSQKATRHAYDVKPYEFNQGLQMCSKQFCESRASKKKCEIPLIYKSSVNGWEMVKIENGCGQVKQNNRFNFRIQAEQNSTIVITHEDNHPLLVKHENNDPLQVRPSLRKYYKQTDNTLIQVTPPCTMSIVIVKQQEYQYDIVNSQSKYKTIPFKLPSNYVRLVIKKSSQEDDRAVSNRRLGQEYMIRPEETFDHGLSNSQGSSWHPFVPIQTESRSRD